MALLKKTRTQISTRQGQNKSSSTRVRITRVQTGAGKDPGTKWATIRRTSEAISFSVAPICYPTEGPIPSRADIHDLAQPFDGNMSVFFAPLGRFVPRFACRAMDESEPHLLRSAKNWVAFFTTSLSSRSMRFSFPSSAISRSRSDWTAGFSGVR